MINIQELTATSNPPVQKINTATQGGLLTWRSFNSLSYILSNLRVALIFPVTINEWHFKKQTYSELYYYNILQTPLFCLALSRTMKRVLI